MKIELNYTKEELSTLLDGLNNAIISLNNTYSAALIGCEIPKQFRHLESIEYDDLEKMTNKRMSALKDLYSYLLSFEQ